MSRLPRQVAILIAVLLAATPRAAAVVVDPPSGFINNALTEPAPGVLPPEGPPDESLRVQVRSLRDVGEGVPLEFEVTIPEFRGSAASFNLTYEVRADGGSGREGVDYAAPRGPIAFDEANVGSFRIPTLVNPAAGGATLLVVVLFGEEIVGRGPGTIVDRPPPRVEVTSSPALEETELVFAVSIDPAAEVRGPWTYAYRLEGESAVEGVDYEPQSGTLAFDADGRAPDVRVRTLRNDNDPGPRTLSLVVTAGELTSGRGQGRIDDDPNLSPVGPVGPGPGPGWSPGPIHIIAGILLLLGLGGLTWWMVRPRPEPPAPAPVPPTFEFATHSGPRTFEAADFGLPELEIETRPGPRVFRSEELELEEVE